MLRTAALAALLALSGMSCKPPPEITPAATDIQTIRTVDPATLATPDGWNAATSAVLEGPGPLWQRGDTAVPVKTPAGTLLSYADTWVRDTPTAARYLVRNTALLVRPDGRVQWLSPGTAAIPAPLGQWFWPAGGVPTEAGAVQFGSLWTSGAGFGTRLSPAVSPMMDAAPRTIPVALSSSYQWGAPYRDGSTVVLPGYDPSTWAHHLATHVYSPRADDYATGWTVQPLTVTSGPLGPLSVRRYGTGWLASAKLLSSAPGLGYEETPEIFAWTAPAAQGPYTRAGTVVADTRRAGTRSYGGSVVDLPSGPVASWSRNVEGDAAPDEYGTIFAPAWLPPS